MVRPVPMPRRAPLMHARRRHPLDFGESFYGLA